MRRLKHIILFCPDPERLSLTGYVLDTRLHIRNEELGGVDRITTIDELRAAWREETCCVIVMDKMQEEAVFEISAAYDETRLVYASPERWPKEFNACLVAEVYRACKRKRGPRPMTQERLDQLARARSVALAYCLTL